MAIQRNSQGTPLKYDRDEYFKKFIPLILSTCSEFEKFSIYDLHKELDLNDFDKRVFKELATELKTYFYDNGLATVKGRKITLTDKGRDIKNGTDNKINLTMNNNDFSNSNIGNVIQDSRNIDLKSPIKQKTVHKTDKEPSKKSSIEIASWIIGSIVGLIAIYKFIMS